MGAKIQAFDIFQTPLSSHCPLPLINDGTFSKLLRNIFELSAGIFKRYMGGARNRVGMGLSYRPAWLHRLVELFLGINP
jgi:hypothetical protein